MADDAIQLTVWQRKGRLFVSAAVIAGAGFRDFEELAAVKKAELARELQAAERRALKRNAKPRGKRFPANWRPPPWSGVDGTKSWTEFLRGLTSVHVLRYDNVTELQHMVPDVGGAMGSVIGAEEGLTASVLSDALFDAPMDEVAARVLEMLAVRKTPRVATRKDSLRKWQRRQEPTQKRGPKTPATTK